MTEGNTPAPPLRLEDIQHWTQVIGRAQQLMLEHSFKAMDGAPPAWQKMVESNPVLHAQSEFWAESIALWQRFINPDVAPPVHPEADKDKRFNAPQWRDNPAFDLIRQSYLLISDHLLKGVDALEGLDPQQHEKIRFATRNFVDAMSPSNFPLTNPVVIEKTLETKGENLVEGLKHMLDDIHKGQLTHTDPNAFRVGENIAVTPGKVIHETPLYQLIQYTPTTEKVLKTPLIIFPPWINRFYILDLKPEKSFIRWAVEQGITVFIVSWKSADAGMADVVWDDYVIGGQVDAIDTVCELLDVKSVHTIGYCVAGTTLAATLAWLTARKQQRKVKSATFFTAQVDFTRAGDLKNFVDENYLALIDRLVTDGYLDGRYMASTFNLLRGRDLIWNYVTNNYLLGNDYAPFDLLYWNGHTTNLPAKWHRSYLVDLYRDNKLVQPGALQIDGTPIDLSIVKTPSYIQAGREDHIAPPASVWKITEHFQGPIRFVLAGSGHIAGVVNPPSAHKYQYWLNDSNARDYQAFVATAHEHKGSWWPDWLTWLREQGSAEVPAIGARIPGEGALKAIEDAPGRYVKLP
jgi:polyhydroxyalkanoate synthase